MNLKNVVKKYHYENKFVIVHVVARFAELVEAIESSQ
jgi:hypothetical protein